MAAQPSWRTRSGCNGWPHVYGYPMARQWSVTGHWCPVQSKTKTTSSLTGVLVKQMGFSRKYGHRTDGHSVAVTTHCLPQLWRSSLLILCAPWLSCKPPCVVVSRASYMHPDSYSFCCNNLAGHQQIRSLNGGRYGSGVSPCYFLTTYAKISREACVGGAHRSTIA